MSEWCHPDCGDIIGHDEAGRHAHENVDGICWHWCADACDECEPERERERQTRQERREARLTNERKMVVTGASTRMLPQLAARPKRGAK